MKKYKSFNMKKVVLLISFLSLLIVICGLAWAFTAVSQYTYRPPENINDGFDVGSLDEVNIDAKLIEKAVNDINRSPLFRKYKEVHSMLIFKDNKLVFEEYFKGHKYKWDGANFHGDLVTWDRSTSHCVHSVTKSITSTCIGIAIDHGFIESVHQSIFDYLPEHQHLNTDGKDKITIEHLLTMTSGLEWNEWGVPYSSLDNDVVGIWFSGKDPITYVLEKSLINEPGTSFTYSGGNMIVLGEIIKNATKMNIDEFSGKYLFEPLGIDSFDWWLRFENGVIEAASGLKITPRDMAKIGVTFLNKGVWNETQIISEQWVEKSATSFPGNEGINIPGEDSGRVGYSYSWWTKQYSNLIFNKRINMYYAGGWGGQHIMVFPELNTVVVFTGGNYVTYRPPFKILKRYVIPAHSIGYTIEFIGGIVGSVIGVLGGIIGTFFSIKNTKTSAERRFVVKCAIGMWVSGILLIFLPLALSLIGLIPKWFYWLTDALFFVLLVLTILWANKHLVTMRKEK